jgi:hypothetical protein
MSGGLFEESVSLEGQALIAAARTSGRTSPPVNTGLDILARRIFSICPSVLTYLQQPEALYRSAAGLSTGGSRRGEVELAHDLDAPLDGPGNGAEIRVDPQHTLYLLAVLLVGGEVESLLDPPEDENLLLRLYLPHRVGVEVLEGNLTRCQRASKGAEQSPAGSSYQIIEGGVVCLLLFWRDAVVLGDLTVDAEQHRLFLDGEIGAAHLALHRFHPHPRDVGYLGHAHLLSSAARQRSIQAGLNRPGSSRPQLPSLRPQSLQGLWVPLLSSRKTASATRIKQIVRTEIATAMNTNTEGEKSSLRIWLRMFNSAVTQRKLNKRIMALPRRYGNRAAEVSIVT